MSNRKELLARIRDLDDQESSVLAAQEFVETVDAKLGDPELAEAQMTLWTGQAMIACGRSLGGKPLSDDHWHDRNEVYARAAVFAHDWGQGLGDHLVLDARSNEVDVIARLLHVDAQLRAAGHKALIPLFDEARRRYEARLDGGLTRRERKGVLTGELRPRFELARELKEAGRLEEAERIWTELCEIDPIEPAYFHGLASVYVQQGRAREALRECLWALHFDPGSPVLTASAAELLFGFDLIANADELVRAYLDNRVGGPSSREDNFARLVPMAQRGSTALTCRFDSKRPADLAAGASSLLAAVYHTSPPWIVELIQRLRVFVSYRRADGAEAARSICAMLRDRNALAEVFHDERSMVEARDFSRQLREWIDGSNAVLVLVTPYWTTQEGLERLQDPTDVVRRELEYADANFKWIILLAIDGASIPATRDLPESLRSAFRRHAIAIDTGWLDVSLNKLYAALVRLARGELIQERWMIDVNISVGRGAEPPDLDTIHVRKVIPFDTLEPGYREFLNDKGWPLDQVTFDGVWSCEWRSVDGSRGALEFTIGDMSGSQLRGTIEENDEKLGFVGQWAYVEGANDRVAGLNLSLLVGSDNRGFFLPFFQRMTEHAFHGELPDGTTWGSRNEAPRDGTI